MILAAASGNNWPGVENGGRTSDVWSNEREILILASVPNRLEITGNDCHVVVRSSTGVINIKGNNCVLLLERNDGAVCLDGNDCDVRIIDEGLEGKVENWGMNNRIWKRTQQRNEIHIRSRQTSLGIQAMMAPSVNSPLRGMRRRADSEDLEDTQPVLINTLPINRIETPREQPTSTNRTPTVLTESPFDSERESVQPRARGHLLDRQNQVLRNLRQTLLQNGPRNEHTGNLSLELNFTDINREPESTERESFFPSISHDSLDQNHRFIPPPRQQLNPHPHLLGSSLLHADSAQHQNFSQPSQPLRTSPTVQLSI